VNDNESVIRRTGILARAPQATAYLRELAKKPQKRPIGSHSGAFVRNAGLTDDEVKLEDGRKMTAQEAAELLGPGWYESTEFTGRERITQRGREELAKLKPKD
jgi:hypothetical protein